MSTTTARDIVTKALQKAGVLFKGEVPDADEANDTFDALNLLISSLSTESLMCYARVWENFPLVAGKLEYQMGPTAADFVTTRPQLIVAAFVRLVASDVDYPVSIINDEDYYNTIYIKDIQSIPEYLNNDNAYPNANLRLWPVPASPYTLFLLSEKELTEFPTLDTQIILPPGWSRMLIYNLAMEIASDFGVQPPQTTVTLAGQSKSQLQLQIMKTRDMDTVPTFTGRRRNILADRVN